MNNHHCPCCGSQFHAVYSRHYGDLGNQQSYQFPYEPFYNYVHPHYYAPRTFQMLITPTELKDLVGKQITTTIKDIGQVKACVVNYDETNNRVTLSNIILIQTGDSLGTQAYRPDELIGYNKIADTCPGTGTGTTPGGTGAGTGVDAPTPDISEEQLQQTSVLTKTITSFGVPAPTITNPFRVRTYRVWLEVTVPTIIAQQVQGILDRCMRSATQTLAASLAPYFTPATYGGLPAAIPGALATATKTFTTCVGSNPIIYPFINRIKLDVKAGYV
jgi:hypothetical protein